MRAGIDPGDHSTFIPGMLELCMYGIFSAPRIEPYAFEVWWGIDLALRDTSHRVGSMSHIQSATS